MDSAQGIIERLLFQKSAFFMFHPCDYIIYQGYLEKMPFYQNAEAPLEHVLQVAEKWHSCGAGCPRSLALLVPLLVVLPVLLVLLALLVLLVQLVLVLVLVLVLAVGVVCAVGVAGTSGAGTCCTTLDVEAVNNAAHRLTIAPREDPGYSTLGNNYR